jgi:integrase
MPLKLIPPGKRRNKFYLARGRLNGRLYEVTTGETDKGAADRRRAEIEHKILGADVADAEVTFRRAAELYCAFKNPSREYQQRIDRLVGVLGHRQLSEIQHAHLVGAARTLYPGAKASSMNRSVIAPGAAILHYAAENKLCAYRRIKRFKEAAPVTRALSKKAAAKLIGKAEGDAKALLLWLFHQGTRISDALKVQWPDIDLKAKTYRLRISKTDEWRVLPLADSVWAHLRGAKVRKGPVFPWRNRWAAYAALGPIAKKAKVRFTPHMARHSLGTWLNQSGAGLRTIMGALGHKDAKSSMRYQAADVEIIRSAVGMAVGKS